MTILSDRPNINEKSDLLHLESSLSGILDVLRHRDTSCPISIAIYGDWGTGKTSALNWLEHELRAWNETKSHAEDEGRNDLSDHPRVYPIWFDPWKYHTREDVWRGIISEVILSLVAVGNLDRDNLGKRLTSTAKKFGSFLGTSFLHALRRTEFKVEAKATVPGAKAGPEVKLSGEVFGDIADELTKFLHPEKGYLNEFEETLKKWINDLLQSQARVALLIDDLDRCLPDVTLEVLEAIKLYLNIPQIMFVVGLDREMVESIIEHHYEEKGPSKEKAKDYLSKMFQVHVDISPTDSQMKDFLEKQVQHLDQASSDYWKTGTGSFKEVLESTIRSLSRNNPREVKRLLNSALLRGRAAEDNPLIKPRSKNLFAQGAQVFLIQKILLDKVDKISLSQDSFVEWMATLASFAYSWPNYRIALQPEDPAKGGEPRSPDLARLDKRFETILSGTLYKLDGKAIVKMQIIDQNMIWELFQIPFNAQVARCASPVEGDVRRPTISERFRHLSSKLLASVAKTRKTTIGRLSDSDFLEVTELDLSRSDVGSEELSSLESFSSLTKLDLKTNQLSDGVLTNLASLRKLVALDLENNRIAGPGLSSLTKIPTLEDLDLENNNLGPDDLKFLGLHDRGTLPALQFLVLTNNPIRNEGLQLLKERTGFKGLFLAKTGIDAAGLGTLSELKELTEFVCYDNALTDDAFDTIGGFHNLLSLILNNNKLTGIKLASLSGSVLKTLALSRNPLGNTGLAALPDASKLPNLEVLFLHHIGLDDHGLEALQDRNLLDLDLGRNKITNAGLKQLAKLNPKLTVLGLIGNEGIDDGGLRHLKELKHLKNLNLAGTGVTASGLKHLSELEHLEILVLPKSIDLASAGVRQLQEAKKSLEITLRGTR